MDLRRRAVGGGDAAGSYDEWANVKRPTSRGGGAATPLQRLARHAAELFLLLVVLPILVYMVWDQAVSAEDPHSIERVLELKANATRAIQGRFGVCESYRDGIKPVRVNAHPVSRGDVLVMMHTTEVRREQAAVDTWARYPGPAEFFYFGDALTQSEAHERRLHAGTRHAHARLAELERARHARLNDDEGEPPSPWEQSRAALQEAYDNHPAAKWFVKVDDHSFVYVDRLLRLLTGFDPRQRHYLGSAMYAMRPDDHEGRFNFHFAYAHGGAGYVLSRAALRAALEAGLGAAPGVLPRDEAMSLAAFLRDRLDLHLTAIEGLHAYAPEVVEELEQDMDPAGAPVHTRYSLRDQDGAGGRYTRRDFHHHGDGGGHQHARSTVVFRPALSACEPVSFHHVSPRDMYSLYEQRLTEMGVAPDAVELPRPGVAEDEEGDHHAELDRLAGHNSWARAKLFARYADLHAEVRRQMHHRARPQEESHDEAFVMRALMYDLRGRAVRMDEWLHGLASNLLLCIVADCALFVTQPASFSALGRARDQEAAVAYPDLFDDDVFHFFADETALAEFDKADRRRHKVLRREARKAEGVHTRPDDLVIDNPRDPIFHELAASPNVTHSLFVGPGGDGARPPRLVRFTTTHSFLDDLLGNGHYADVYARALRLYASVDEHGAATGSSSGRAPTARDALLTLVDEVLRPSPWSKVRWAVTAVRDPHALAEPEDGQQDDHAHGR